MGKIWDGIKNSGLYDKIVNDGKLPSTEVEIVVPNRTLYRLAFVLISIVVIGIVVSGIVKTSTK